MKPKNKQASPGKLQRFVTCLPSLDLVINIVIGWEMSLLNVSTMHIYARTVEYDN